MPGVMYSRPGSLLEEFQYDFLYRIFQYEYSFVHCLKVLESGIVQLYIEHVQHSRPGASSSYCVASGGGGG